MIYNLYVFPRVVWNPIQTCTSVHASNAVRPAQSAQPTKQINLVGNPQPNPPYPSNQAKQPTPARPHSTPKPASPTNPERQPRPLTIYPTHRPSQTIQSNQPSQTILHAAATMPISSGQAHHLDKPDRPPQPGHLAPAQPDTK